MLKEVIMKKIISMFILCTLLLFVGCKNNNEVQPCGEVNFTVVDGFSGMPIENAKIVIPEGNLTGITDSLGKCNINNVPIFYDERYPIKQGYGTFSVLGYKEGYNDYALFFAHLKEGELRNIKIYMFTVDTPFGSGTPLSTIESPDNEWVAELLEKYRK